MEKRMSQNESGKNTNFLEEETYFIKALEIIQCGGLPMVLKVVSELNVFNIMAKAGPGCQLSAKEIADQLSINNPDAPSMLDRMLRLLTTHSVVNCSIDSKFERRYGLTPLSNLFIPDESRVSLAPFLALVEDDVVRSNWSKLKDAVERGGVPFKMAHNGIAPFDYPGIDPRFNNVFNKAMYNYSTLVVTKMVQKCKGLFNDIKVLVDVGGGIGHTLNAIISQYPSIKGINFDLPHVISNAMPYPGVEHVAGNMFESIPKGDAVLMKGILHDWTDEYCKKLLKNCYEALPKNGKVIILELILTDKPETTDVAKAISQFDVYLMNIGGKERTKKETFDLATYAGFNTHNIVLQLAQYSVIEFIK